jgi:hypothetical protein
VVKEERNAPLTKLGKNTLLVGKIIEHSLPTLMAVRTLSPVTILVGM